MFNTSLGIALLINIIFLLLVIIFCDIKYEVSDDFIMASILSGAFGNTQNPQMIFVNVIWGYFLLPFYNIMPGISWYFIAQISLIFFSSVAVTYLLLEITEKPKAILLSILLILFFANDAYILLQFTKTAMFAVMAGAMLFIWGLFKERGISVIVFGFILCLLGGLLRFTVIYMAGGFILFILIFEFIELFRKEKNKKYLGKKLLKIICSGIILIGTVFALNEFNDYTYSKDDSYKFFYEYSSARSSIVDSADLGYWTYEQELKKIGISENDYKMIRTWNFADNKVFSLEKLKQVGEVIASYNKNYQIGLGEIIETFQNRGIAGYPIFVICLVVFIIGIFLNYDKWWTMIGAGGIGGLCLLYFMSRGRNVYRTEFSVFLGVFMCGLYFWQKNVTFCNIGYIGRDKNVVIKKICAIITIVFCLYMGYIYLPDNSYKYVTSDDRRAYVDEVFFDSWDYDVRKYRKVVNRKKPANELLTEIKNNKDNFYYLDFATTIQTLYYEWEPWKAMDIGYFDNMAYLSGITSNFPDVVNNLEERNVEEGVKSLVDKNVYLVDDQHVETKLDYLKEHYYPNARAELYKEIGGYQIWKFYKE